MALSSALAVFGGSFSALADTNCGIVTADALNVRALPNTESAVLGQLPYGSSITFTDKLDNWYVINYNGSNAYICADYINLTDGIQPSDAQSTVTQNAAPVIVVSPDVPSYENSAVPGEMLVELAKQFIGTPYVYGGMSPQGFDCSGFVKYCYSLMGVEINRVACDQAKNGYEVPYSGIKPGDIICFSSSVGGSYIGHTGIYVGNGYFIHSRNTGSFVEIAPLTTGSYADRIANIRRIFN